jgi:hypothetical protein
MLKLQPVEINRLYAQVLHIKRLKYQNVVKQKAYTLLNLVFNNKCGMICVISKWWLYMQIYVSGIIFPEGQIL